MTSYESSGLGEGEASTKYMDLINKIQENGYGKNIYSMIERAIVNNQQFEVGKECIFEGRKYGIVPFQDNIDSPINSGYPLSKYLRDLNKEFSIFPKDMTISQIKEFFTEYSSYLISTPEISDEDYAMKFASLCFTDTHVMLDKNILIHINKDSYKSSPSMVHKPKKEHEFKKVKQFRKTDDRKSDLKEKSVFPEHLRKYIINYNEEPYGRFYEQNMDRPEDGIDWKCPRDLHENEPVFNGKITRFNFPKKSTKSG